MNTPVSFEIAKLLKEKGYDILNLYFYTKPNTKMFGIDEHGRYYPMKNKAKSLWTTGNAAALKIENVYQAPTIAEVVMWLYEKHGIWISVNPTQDLKAFWHEIRGVNGVWYMGNNYSNPTEGYEAAIKYTLKNLLK